eukprot:939676_1
MSYRHRSSTWIKQRKHYNSVVNNKEWWAQYTQQFVQITNIQTHESPNTTALPDLFDIDYLLDVLVEEQVLCFLDRDNAFTINYDVCEWLKYHDNNLLRRMRRISKNQSMSNNMRDIAVNIAGKLRIVLHKDSTSYTVTNSQYKNIISKIRYFMYRNKCHMVLVCVDSHFVLIVLISA